MTPKASDFHYSDTDDEHAGDTIDAIEWSKAPNPWGADGYQLGDVALFANDNPGLEHFEALLPSPRYELNPFAASQVYSTTHRTNGEGFQVVELRRDPVAQLDWGFTVDRHEFGGACLVTSVDPVSPASSAVSYRETNKSVQAIPQCLSYQRSYLPYFRCFLSDPTKATQKQDFGSTI
jgi:hypothetical protein